MKPKAFSLSAILLAASCFMMPASAFADANIEAIPTAWRLQEYIPGNITTWYTGITNCGDGGLRLPSTATEETKQRYWSLIMTAKVARQKVGIFYDNNSGYCTINSFYLIEG